MDEVIDTCIWVDYFGLKTPPVYRKFANEAVLKANAVLCEPVKLEFLQGVGKESLARPTLFFSTLPVLTTPLTLWSDALKNARACAEKGLMVGTLDILIATITIHHNAILVTFDGCFQLMTEHINLRTKVLNKPD